MDYILPLEYLSFDPRPKWDLFNSHGRDGYNPNWREPGDPAGHEGNDLYNVLNFDIMCAKAGYCTASGWLNGGAGYGVEIFSPDVVSAPLAGQDGDSQRYLHMPKDGPIPQVGDWVEQGQVIGRIGMSGATRSPHLQWGVGKIRGYNPRKSILAQWLSFPPESTGYLEKEEEPEPTPEAVPVYWPTLTKGDGYKTNKNYKPLVKRMQSMLAIEGCIEYGPNFAGDGSPDGAYGPSSQRGLEKYQRREGLPVGQCDMPTWVSLSGAIV